MFCPECGKEIEEGSAFCPNCGAKIEGDIKVSLSTNGVGKQALPLIGGALLLISFFMTWVDMGLGISVSGYNLIRLADSGTEKFLSLLSWLVPIGGGITAYFAYRKSSFTKYVSFVSGIVALVVWIWLLIGIGTGMKELTGKLTGSSCSFSDVFEVMGVGFYIMLAGIVCLGIATIKSFFTENK